MASLAQGLIAWATALTLAAPAVVFLMAVRWRLRPMVGQLMADDPCVGPRRSSQRIGTMRRKSNCSAIDANSKWHKLSCAIWLVFETFEATRYMIESFWKPKSLILELSWTYPVPLGSSSSRLHSIFTHPSTIWALSGRAARVAKVLVLRPFSRHSSADPCLIPSASLQ